LLVLREGGGEPEKAKKGTFLWLSGGIGTGIASLEREERQTRKFL
jgi:hypothetical protein